MPQLGDLSDNERYAAIAEELYKVLIRFNNEQERRYSVRLGYGSVRDDLKETLELKARELFRDFWDQWEDPSAAPRLKNIRNHLNRRN